MCESIKPGTTVRPSRSIMRVPAPANARTSAEVPTATILPSRMASASAVGMAASRVTIFPLSRTVSAFWPKAADPRPDVDSATATSGAMIDFIVVPPECCPSPRLPRRGDHRARDGLLRKEQFHHLAVRVGLHEVERGRQVRQIGIALQRALNQQGHLLVAQPIGPLLLEAGPRPIADTLYLAALDRERDLGGTVIAGDDLELGAD